ncbi:hypothetical protein [Jiangella gansuensis]|uniref:hypothetical protein n=1 Tax=Jiangella gansuensis TaxID=281473 RepID=UPI0004B60348|nr:hypothetical protein [Jiangella gansuensis]
MRELTDDGQGTTGDASVDEAVRSLERLDRLPVHQHADVIDDVHRALQDRLADEAAADEPAADQAPTDEAPTDWAPTDVAATDEPARTEPVAGSPAAGYLSDGSEG